MTEEEQKQKRGDATRAALIQAGLELFGEFGFQATTTRMLCDHAGANISAIPYYFGGKKGLYHAVLHHIVERIQEKGFANHEALQALFSDEMNFGPVEALAALKNMLAAVTAFNLKSDEPRKWMQIIIREQAKPTDGFDIIYNNHMKHVQALINRLIGICLGKDANSDEVKVRNHAMFGQVMGFLIAREALLRMLGVRKLEEQHIELITNMIQIHVEAILRDPRAVSQEAQ